MTENGNFVIFCIKLPFLIFTTHLKKKPPIEIGQIRFFLFLALYSNKKIRTRRLRNFLSFQPLPEQCANIMMFIRVFCISFPGTNCISYGIIIILIKLLQKREMMLSQTTFFLPHFTIMILIK